MTSGGTNEQRAVAALTSCVAGSVDCDWELRRLAEAGHAHVFAAHRALPSPAGTTASETLVVKLFDPRDDDAQVLLEQRDAMHELRLAVDRMQIDGWTITAPRVVGCDPARRALIIDYAAGRSLRQLMQAQRPDSATWQGWADVTLAGLMRYWDQSGRIYGDLNLRNILCDPTHRSIAFIDAGAPGPHWHIHQPPCRWFPASRDLAYLLFFVATEIKLNLLQPRLRAQQLDFVHYLLQRFAQQAVMPAQRAAFIQELRYCAAVHLAALDTGWTLRGVWTRQVRQRAEQTIDLVLHQLGSDGDVGRQRSLVPIGQEAASR